jgi:hypothetical protein
MTGTDTWSLKYFWGSWSMKPSDFSVLMTWLNAFRFGEPLC